MAFNKSPLSRLKRNLSLQSCFLEVRYSDAFGCKSPDDNALSVNDGLSCDGIRHNVDACLDIDDQCTSPASSCGQTSTALRRVFPLKSRSLYKPVSDVQNSNPDCFKLFQKQLEVMSLWLWICPHDQVVAPTPRMNPDDLALQNEVENTVFFIVVLLRHRESRGLLRQW